MKFRMLLYLAVALVLATSVSACAGLSPTDEPAEIPPASQPTQEPTQAPPEPTAGPTQEPTMEPGENELAGTAWILADMNGSAPLAGTTITLAFDERQLGGAACNSYGGDYTASAGVIEVGELISTLMACGEPAGVMDQETAYLSLLGQATRYELSADRLTLGTADSLAALVFTSGAVQAPPQGWLSYQDQDLGFEVSFPDSGVPVNANPPTVGDENSVRIDLPFEPGTNLQEKYLQIDAQADAGECASPHTEGYAPDMLAQDRVTLNEFTWDRASAGGAAAGNFYEFTAYTLSQGGACVSLTFVLHSTNVGNYPTPPPEFDREAESAVFEEIVQTFRWLP